MAVTQIRGNTQIISNTIDNSRLLNLTIDDTKISATAAIAYGKLNLSNSIVDGDIASAAAIAYSKLSLTNSIVNADIASAAAIALNKLAATTASRALVSDGSGFVSASATTATEIGYVSGVTSAIQTQLDAKVAKSGSTMTGFLTLSGDPTANLHAATKQYVDNVAAGLDTKESVRVATTVAGTLASDFEAGDVIDTVTLVAGNRILIKNQADAKENGIYVVQAFGAPVRSSDMDGTPANEVSSGNFTFVESGSQSSTGWVVLGDGILTLGIDDINWTQFSETGTVTYVAGAGLTQTGSGTVTFNVVSADTSLTVNANDVAVNLATNGGLEISSGVKIKPDTTTADTLAITLTSNGAGVKYDSNSFSETSESLTLASGVAGAGLALTTGVLSVNVDASTIEINSDTLRVKDLGITTAKLAAGAVTYAKSSMATREVPTGSINGSNVTFTLANVPTTAGSEHVFLNGILQNAGGSNDYTISSDTITFNTAPATGDVLLVSYWK